jgi:hypothetical protein
MLLQEFSSVKKRSKLVEHTLTEADIEFGPETGRELYPAGYASDGRFILHVVNDLLPRIKSDELTLKVMRDIEAIENSKASKENIQSVMAVFKAAKEQGLVKKYEDAKGKFDKDYKDSEEDVEEADLKEAYINTSQDAIKTLGALRKIGKSIERGQETYDGNLANMYVNDVYDVISWVENNLDTNEPNYRKVLGPVIELRKKAKDMERKTGSGSDGQFGNQIVNTLYPLMQWIEMNSMVTKEGNAYAHAVRKAKMDGAEKGDKIDGPDGKKIKIEAEDMTKDSALIAMSDEAHELVLYAENDSQLYSQSAVPIMKNLTRKHKKGTYDPALAVKLWKYHADRAAKKYGKEHGNDDGFKLFSPAVRMEAAKHFEEYWTEELNAGNTMESKVTENKDQALRQLRDIMNELEGLGDAAASIMQEHFPSQYSQGEAYDAFNFGTSSNKYNTTLESLINDIAQGGDSEDEVDEGKQDRIQKARDLLDRACGLDACSPEELGDHRIDMIAQETGLKRGHVKSIANHMDDEDDL